MVRYKKEEALTLIDLYQQIYPNSDKEIKSLTFQVTEDCCLKCTYCYQINKSQNKMTLKTAKKFIDSLCNDEYSFANRNNCAGFTVDFIGGEPLMEIELIEQIIEYFLKVLISLNHPWKDWIAFGICSNGILFDTPKVQNFFKKYHNICYLAISIDGNRELHDSCRVDFNGNGSYDRAIGAAKLYKKLYGQLPNTKMTLSPFNVRYTKDAVINLINEGYTEIHLNCQYEIGWELKHAQILYDQLKELGDYIIENDLYDKVVISMFNEDYYCPMDKSDNKNWCGGVCEKMLAINYTGNLYPCLRYMESSLGQEQKPIILGNINRGYISNKDDIINLQKIQNITRKSQSSDECFNCQIAMGCGWCSAYNYQITGTPNQRCTYICLMHKATALANVYYWNKLYNYLNISNEKIFKNYVNLLDIEKIILSKGENDNGKQFVKKYRID